MPAKRIKRRKKKGALFVVLILLALLAVGGYLWVQGIMKGLRGGASLPEDSELLPSNESSVISDDLTDKSIVNIALFGVDRRNEGESARSDAIMIASVDKKHNKIKLSSILRDTYVEIEGYGYDKLGHAYAFGGPALAIKTLNNQFNLNITDYVTVNFSEMAQIVDAVGGVDIELSEEERLAANHNMIEQAAIDGVEVPTIEAAGLQHLNGMQAVGYARIRYVGNADFERTDRQREVMKQIFEKGKKASILQYPAMAQKLLPVVETSLTFSELMNMAGIMLRDVTFEDVRFPQTSDLIGNGALIIDGIWYLNADIDSISEKLHSFIYDDILPVDE